ncbi:MAG: hypothetical protein IJ158_09475 [Treponema sp.]|nr:hypothetical protein [Treponema sp.]
MKKILTGLVAFALALSFASADVKFSFSNKLYEEDPIAWHEEWTDENTGKKESETETDFPPLNEQMHFEIFTDRVDAMVEATMWLDDDDDDSPSDSGNFYFDGEISDYYIEFRPIKPITLSLHTGIFSDGSYLPVYDDNLWAGNIGSNGFTVTYRPSALDDALRISVTTPFNTLASDDDRSRNYLNGDVTDDDDDDEFDIGIGAIYTAELFQVGASFQDLFDSDERQIGAYVNLPTLFGVSDALTVGAGFAHSERDRVAFDDLTAYGGIGYENLLSTYVTFDLEKFSIAAELLYNFGLDNKSGHLAGHGSFWDFYTAASVSFGIVDSLTATATGKLLVDSTSDGEKSVIAGAFGIDYDINDNNTIGAEFDIDTFDGNWTIAIPVYWEYHFDK